MAMDIVIFYQPPTSINGHHGRSIAPRNLLSSPLYKRFPSILAQNRSRGDATRCVDGGVVISHSDSPSRGEDQPLISAERQSLDRLDTLVDSGDELPSLKDLLSHAWPLASRVAPQVIDLTIDFFDYVSKLHELLGIIRR
jgi:hypothetical protein